MRANEYPPNRSLFIGRWQPLHDGHVALIRTALDEGREVVIGIMDTPESARNPHSVWTRRARFAQRFYPEWRSGQLTLLTMPWIDEVCYGRDVGWACREIRLDAETEAISGTELREGVPSAEELDLLQETFRKRHTGVRV